MSNYQIKVDLSDQEALILNLYNIVTATQNLRTQIQAMISDLIGVSGKGYFSYYYGNGNSGSNSTKYASDSGQGLGDFSTKALQVQTMAEVLHRHVQNNYSTMVDTDRMLAIEYVESLLNGTKTTDEENLKYVRENQEEAVDYYTQQFKEQNGGGQ